jgi:hypothetical protein
MRTLALTLALLPLLACQAWAQAGGLYFISVQPTDKPITTLDGRMMFLGRPFAEKIDEVDLISQTNDDSDYSLVLKQNKPYSIDVSTRAIALVLQKKALFFGGCGGSPTQRDYATHLSDPDFIRNTEAFFKIMRQDRKHPGHQFTARFAVNAEGYELSQPVIVTLEITNCGTQPFTIESPGVPKGMTDVFTFTAHGSGTSQWDMPNNAVASKPYRPAPLEMLTQLVAIKPSATLGISVDLKKYLIIKKKGLYSCRGTYAFKVMDPAPKAHKVLWDDYATADFEVRIK